MLEEEKILNPDAIYRTAPFWAWNGTMTEENIKRTVKELKKAGFGGAFVHPRPGLTNEYLSEEWFALWEIALEEARREGMKLYIYDENTYPSGYAGGHIMSQLPDCAAQSVKTRIFESSEDLKRFQNDPERPEEERRWIRLYRARREDERFFILEDLTETSDITVCGKNEVYVGIGMQRPYASVWFGGFPNTDILRPEVTKALLDCTYEEYRKRFQQDFGTVIPAVFSDEPGISPGSVWLEDPMAFPFSRYLAAEFYRRRGYILEDHMICIPLDIEQIPGKRAGSKVRFDYYCTLRELWVENFAEPIQEWCREHGIAWTGHFLDEHWPYPWGGCSPAVMSMYEYMQWPGIDMLMGHMLKENGKSPMLLSVKELSSVGNQLGKERLLCECYGAGGWDAGISDFKRIGDWLAIHGITFFNQHLWLQSLSGVRKQGHPQSFDPREPWWEEYGRLTTYYARLSYLLSQGRAEHKVLVLNPATSWFIRCPSDQKGDILWKYKELPDSDPVKTYIEFLQCLNQNHVGFDLGDEFILQTHGRVESTQFVIGESAYDCIVIPAEMQHMLSSTVRLIKAALSEGMEVFCLGKPPFFIDGEQCEESDWGMISIDQEELIEDMKRKNRQILPIEGEGIECNLRRLESGENICCFSNSTPKVQCILAELPGTELWLIDLFTGKKKEYIPERRAGKTEIKLQKNEMLALYWIENADPIWNTDLPVQITKNTPRNFRKKTLEPVGIRLKEKNVLVLDYGNLYLRDKEYRDIHVMAASEKIFHAHGMEQNPWDMAVQFKNRWIERNHFGENSGFSMKFRFETAEKLGNLEMVCEHLDLYHIWINGRRLSYAETDVWLDEEFGRADISEYVVCGRNEIRIDGTPFQMLMELQPIYILGDFSVNIEQGRFVLKKGQTLRIGGLKEQGVVFYGGRIQYEYRFFIDEKNPAEHYSILIGDYEGTALSLYVNGDFAGQAGIGMGEMPDITSWVKAGSNNLKVEVSGSLKNVFGPFHTQGKIRNSAWPAAWKQAPAYGRPGAENYDTIDYGLKENLALIYYEV